MKFDFTTAGTINIDNIVAGSGTGPVNFPNGITGSVGSYGADFFSTTYDVQNSSGAFTLSYCFVISPLESNINSGAVYTNNSVTFTARISMTTGTPFIVFAGTGDPTTSGTLTKSSGTGPATIAFVNTKRPSEMNVTLVGGGGGGACGGTQSVPAGDGQISYLTLPSGDQIIAGRGEAGQLSGRGAGSSSSTILPLIRGVEYIAIGEGQVGGPAGYGAGGNGGSSGLSIAGGGGGGPAVSNTAGLQGDVPGGGGGGASSAGAATSGSGGGGGNTILLKIINPSGSYTYQRGVGGTAGTGTTSGGAGGNGGVSFTEIFNF